MNNFNLDVVSIVSWVLDLDVNCAANLVVIDLWVSTMEGFWCLEGDFDAIWIPGNCGVSDEGMDLSRGADICVNSNFSVEFGSSGVKVHTNNCTLSRFNVGSAKGFDLHGFDATIEVVEALGSVSSRGGQVFVCLELPVGPTIEVIVTNISNLGDFSSAVIRVHAGTEFTEDEWDTKILGILVSGTNSLLGPLVASLLSSFLWLSVFSTD